MTEIVRVRCAARWSAVKPMDYDGPFVELDLAFLDFRDVDKAKAVGVFHFKPAVVWMNSQPIHVSEAHWQPGKTITPPNGKPYYREAEITARLPMENGAILDLSWPDKEIVSISIGHDTPNGWIPLRERERDLQPSHDCPGNECAEATCGSSFHLEEFDRGPDIVSLTRDQILAIWKRCGSKPIVPYSEPVVVPKPSAPRTPTLLEQRMKRGQTITLDEWRQSG